MLYINTCGQLLDEYYSEKIISYNLVSRGLRKIKRVINSIKEALGLLEVTLFNNEYFRYGKDRVWIRAIVTKNNRSGE